MERYYPEREFNPFDDAETRDEIRREKEEREKHDERRREQMDGFSFGTQQCDICGSAVGSSGVCINCL